MNNIKEKILTAIVLGDGFFGKIRFLIYIFLFPLFRVFHILVHAPCIRLKYNGIPFVFYPTDGSDVGILRDIFLKKEYAHTNVKPHVILDLGSNVGVAAMYFAIMFPNASIFCFEPDPDNFLKLKKNTEQFDSVHIFNVAVSTHDGYVDFYSHKVNGMSSSVMNRGDGFHKITTLSKTLDTIINNLPIQKVDLLKFDIEGAEFSVFKNFNSLHKVKHVIGEFHEDLSGESLNSFISLFKHFEVKENVRIQNKRYILYMNHV